MSSDTRTRILEASAALFQRQGYNATGGGRGVGMGTTRAVVIGSVSTLIADYFLSDILLSLFHTSKG